MLCAQLPLEVVHADHDAADRKKPTTVEVGGQTGVRALAAVDPHRHAVDGVVADIGDLPRQAAAPSGAASQLESIG